MAEKIVTRGVVLRETQTKETDKILTVLTAEQGKIAVVARGARRKNSRIAAASELLAYSELVLYEQRGWMLLDEASTLELWDGVRRDVELLSLGSYFAEMAEAVTGEESAGETLSLLLNALYALDRLDRPREQTKAAYELKLLAISGYEPRVMECAACGASAPAEPLFDPTEGLVLCRACAPAGTRRLLPLDPGSLAAMRHVIRAEQKRMLSFSLRGEPMARFTHACEVFARTQLERDFRTLDFYKSIARHPVPDFPGKTTKIDNKSE
ncbi:MAG: DNA repair protein RecO [Oscillospiraceae bacterium]|nr:DNA repair protein RecO [Oscillospiraceae bacterium]